jgi:signal transduction histidine kinase
MFHEAMSASFIKNTSTLVKYAILRASGPDSRLASGARIKVESFSRLNSLVRARRTMRMQWKIALFGVAIIILMTSVVVWRGRAFLREDKLAFVADSSMKQMSTFKRFTRERLETEKAGLVGFVSRRTTAGAGRERGFGNFDVIALARPGEGNSAWNPTWIEKGPLATTDKWPSEYEMTLLKSLPFVKVKDGEAYWVRLSDAQGNPIFAVIVSIEIQAPNAAPSTNSALPDTVDSGLVPVGTGQRAMAIGFASNDPLASITDDFIGSTSEVYVIDDKGYVAAHVEKSNLGTLFTSDPVVADILKSKSPIATGSFVDSENRPVIAHYERIDKTNLVAVETTPQSLITTSLSAFTKSTLLLGGLLSLLAFGASFLVSRNAESEPAGITNKPVESGAVETRRMDKDLSDIDSVVRRIRLERESTVDTTVLDAIREPLLAILGHAQLVKSKSEGEAQGHAESIEREARKVRDLMDKLNSLQNVQQAQENSTDNVEARGAIDQVMARYRDRFAQEHIKVNILADDVPRIAISQDILEQVLVQIFENSIEALASRNSKLMTIRLNFYDGATVLAVEDTGIGMSRDIREKAFNPMFKAFESPERTGLGLTFVKSVMDRFGGAIDLESIPGEGTTLSLAFPVGNLELKQFEAERLAVQSHSPVAVPQVEPPSAFSFGAKEPVATVEVVPPSGTEAADDVTDTINKAASESPANPPTADSSDATLVPIEPPKLPPPVPIEPHQPTLGGRPPLTAEVASGLPKFPGLQDLPPVPAFELSDVETKDEIKDETKEEDQEEPPGPSMNVTPVIVPTPPPLPSVVSLEPAASGSSVEPAESIEDKFQVKIRRPKPRS